MATGAIFLLFSFVAASAQGQVLLEADRPWLRVKISDTASLMCCYKGKVGFTWVKHLNSTNNSRIYGEVAVSDRVSVAEKEATTETFCGELTFKSVELSDTGMYRCRLNSSHVSHYTHGTYLQVYKPMEKMINLSESTKNKILTLEGILLFVAILGPSVVLLFKTKKLHELEKKKVNREEENIYQGLNLDDCCTAYDQIERSQAPGPYEDVCNVVEEEQEEIQLEKP